MAAQLFREGLLQLANGMLNNGPVPVLWVSLFTAPTSINADTTFSDIVFPADPTVTPIELDPSIWNLVLETGAVAQGDQPPLFWLFTGTPSESYYGYVVYNTNDSSAVWGELFATSVPNTLGSGFILELQIDFGAIDAS